jgi:hypothetical protein
MSALEHFRATLAEAAAPLLDRLTEIDEQLVGLREERDEIRGLLRKADLLPKQNGKPPTKPKASSVTGSVSEEKIAQVLAYMVAHRPVINADGGWSVPVMQRREDWIGLHQTLTNRAMNHLHERGLIVLDHMGSGGSKFYKVV